MVIAFAAQDGRVRAACENSYSVVVVARVNVTCAHGNDRVIACAAVECTRAHLVAQVVIAAAANQSYLGTHGVNVIIARAAVD